MVDAMDIDGSDQPPEGRLMITKMVMNDFKSYAGEQVVGEFHKVRCHVLLVLSCQSGPAAALLARR